MSKFVENYLFYKGKVDSKVILELQKFNRFKRLLYQLQEETDSILDDAINCSKFSEDLIRDCKILKEERSELNKILNNKPCFIIHGQDYYGKLATVSCLIGEQPLPISLLTPPDNNFSCRAIEIAHSFRPIFYLSSDGSLSNVNGLVENKAKQLELIQVSDLRLTDKEILAINSGNIKINIGINHPYLKSGAIVAISPILPQGLKKPLINYFKEVFMTTVPIMIYAITKAKFSKEELDELEELKIIYPNLPILFINIPLVSTSSTNDLPESEQHDILVKLGIVPIPESKSSFNVSQISTENELEASGEDEEEEDMDCGRNNNLYHIPNSLLRILNYHLGFLKKTRPPPILSKRLVEGKINMYSEYFNHTKEFEQISKYLRILFKSHLYNTASILHQVHLRCMRSFILYTYDMAREIQITPIRIKYAKEKEVVLYETLKNIACKKQSDLKCIIMDSLTTAKEDILTKASNYDFKVDLPPKTEDLSIKDIRTCTEELQELILTELNEAVGKQLVSHLDIMRESYLGTLQRCLESLERDCEASGENSEIQHALKQMVNAAYRVEISLSSSSSFLRAFWEKVKQLVTVMPGCTPPVIDAYWKCKVADDILTNLASTKLVKSICSQLRDRLKTSHDSFLGSMKQMESTLSDRLEQTEEQQTRIKKVIVPKIARLSLETTSLKDKLLYGMPKLEKEIGRGHFGVVYGCKTWGNYKPCAIKSLVPLDDRHWNDLAMEFHYSCEIPEHERIVALRGSVIDYTYARGETLAVLLIMERLVRDLHSGIKMGLELPVRLTIALDVTQGLRFLHSQGLVHRDIKLKNVLLDKENRAKLTDLGFCKPEAMMCGSIVGTPIHMAPELFTGHYDSSVDVYAFGILFWYICAGQVKLPTNFDQCQSKDQLWLFVKKGTRPERLPCFTEDCWQLMNECWHGDPTRRPFLGDVEPRIQHIIKHSKLTEENVTEPIDIPTLTKALRLSPKLEINLNLPTSEERRD